MRKALVRVNNVSAGLLEETEGGKYHFSYHPDYKGAPVSLTMPIKNSTYEFNVFPPFFEGLLPEGMMLDSLLKKYKLDKNDYLGQLLQVGGDLVGSVTVEEIK